MKDKYKYLKLIDKTLLRLILDNAELEETEYKLLDSYLLKDNFMEKTCRELSISTSTYRNIQDIALAKVHLTFCFVIRHALKH